MFDDITNGEADIENSRGVVTPFRCIKRVHGVVQGREEQYVDCVDPEIDEEEFKSFLRVLVVD